MSIDPKCTLRHKTKREAGAQARLFVKPALRARSLQRHDLRRHSKSLPGEISAVEPPDPIPNSEVKRSCADGSVAQAMRE